MRDKVDVGAVFGKVLAVAVTIFNRVKKLPASSLMTAQDAWGFAEWLSKDVPDAELNEALRRLYNSYISAKAREMMEKQERQRMESLEWGQGFSPPVNWSHSNEVVDWKRGWRLPTPEELKWKLPQDEVEGRWFWSSKELESDTTYAYAVSAGNGSHPVPKATPLNVRFVREKPKEEVVF